LAHIIPQVVQNLESAGKRDVFQKCLHLVARGQFPMDNNAFVLFLDVVAWFPKPTQVRRNISIPRHCSFGKMVKNCFMAGSRDLCLILETKDRYFKV